ncbi:acyltransferase family protein [Nonomuraea sp. B12E4]|uniref:acyltransferase family protein n=1 Tax=Nonomuraea sp. B12E4 TaxID=3153564 RepID=UPI00325F8826
MFPAPTAAPASTAGGGASPARAGASRLGWADTAKGVCILLVVLWHVVVKHYLQIDWRLDVPITGFWGMLGNALLTLRMPLFFTISGMFATGAFQRPWRVVARSRVAKFLYLYVLWVCIHTALLALVPGFDTASAGSVGEFVEQLTISPPNLWYLYALALYFTVAKALRRVPRPVMLAAALILSAVVAAGYVPIEANRGSLLQNLLFFLAGLYFRPYFERLADTTGRRRAVLITVAYGAAALALMVTGAQQFPGAWPAVCVIATLFGVSVGPLVAAVPGIGSGLAWLGRRTLPIYVIHMPVLALIHKVLVGPLSTVGALGQHAFVFLYPALLTALIVALCLLAENLLRKARATWLFDLPRRRIK